MSNDLCGDLHQNVKGFLSMAIISVTPVGQWNFYTDRACWRECWRKLTGGLFQGPYIHDSGRLRPLLPLSGHSSGPGFQELLTDRVSSLSYCVSPNSVRSNQISHTYHGPMLPQFEEVSEFPGKHRLLDHTPRASHSIHYRVGLENFISRKIPGDVTAAVKGATLWEPLA